MNPESGSTETTPAPRKSLDEIAAMMTENTLRMRGQSPGAPDPAPAPSEVTADESVEEEVVAQPESASEEPDAAVPDDEPDQIDLEPELVADPGSGEIGDDNDFDMEITDDTMFALDDETEVAFKDLKQLYTADKDTLELIETQRTATQEALTERQRAVEQSQKARGAAEAVFKHFESLIATPLWAKPDPSLKTSNPGEYIQRLEMFEQDQQRIEQQRQDLHSAFDQHIQSEKEIKNELKRAGIRTLAEKIPALASPDPQVKARASQDILDAAAHYGFTKDEVNEAIDYRMYQMAHDAQQYRKIMDKSKQTGVNEEVEKTTRVRNQTRTLRPRGTTANQRLTAQAKRVKVAKAVAQKSGKVDDVADFIAAQKRK